MVSGLNLRTRIFSYCYLHILRIRRSLHTHRNLPCLFLKNWKLYITVHKCSTVSATFQMTSAKTSTPTFPWEWMKNLADKNQSEMFYPLISITFFNDSNYNCFSTATSTPTPTTSFSSSYFVKKITFPLYFEHFLPNEWICTYLLREQRLHSWRLGQRSLAWTVSMNLKCSQFRIVSVWLLTRFLQWKVASFPVA